METAQLIIQCILAAAFTITGFIKVLVPIRILKEKMSWPDRYSGSTIRLVGYSELFASLGLILPLLMEVGRFMIPVAACGLAVIQIMALIDHYANGEKREIMLNLLLLVMTLFVIVGTLFL